MDEIGRSLWLLISLMLLFLMIPGLGLIGSGVVRKQHSLSQLSSSFLLLCHGLFIFGLIGYGLIFGKDFLAFQNLEMIPEGGVPHSFLFLFHSFFFCLTLVILQGVWAERAKQVPFLIFGLLWGTFIYLPLAYLLWSQASPFIGWKIVDFAGGLNVHVSTGFAALSMSLIGGRRKDYFNLKFKFSNTSIFLGTILIWLGWIGFNGGSSLVLNDSTPKVVLNTILASVSSSLAWYWIDKFHTPHKSTLKGFVLGLVCGLVSITPACAYLSSGKALLLGFLGGIIGNYSIRLMNRTFKQDDVLEVYSTHGVCGVWGSLGCLLFIENFSFNVSQQLGITFVVGAYSFLGTSLLIKIIGIKRILLDESNLNEGLDQWEHGESILNWESGS